MESLFHYLLLCLDRTICSERNSKCGLLSLTHRIDKTNGTMDRTIVRHVRWHVHAAGTWKPPLAPESDYYTEGEEEDRVSGCRLTLCLYTLLWGTRPQMAGQTAPTETFATTLHKKEFCVCILP